MKLKSNMCLYLFSLAINSDSTWCTDSTPTTSGANSNFLQKSIQRYNFCFKEGQRSIGNRFFNPLYEMLCWIFPTTPCCVPNADFIIDCDLSNLSPNLSTVSRQLSPSKLFDCTDHSASSPRILRNCWTLWALKWAWQFLFWVNR